MVDVIFGVVAKLRDAPPSRSRGIALTMSSSSRLPYISVIFVVAKHLDAPLSRRLWLCWTTWSLRSLLWWPSFMLRRFHGVFGFAGVVDVIFGAVAAKLPVEALS